MLKKKNLVSVHSIFYLLLNGQVQLVLSSPAKLMAQFRSTPVVIIIIRIITIIIVVDSSLMFCFIYLIQALLAWIQFPVFLIIYIWLEVG